MTEKIDRPDEVDDDHLEYLDGLQASAVTNMYGAARYVADQFGITSRMASTILSYWMESYDERHPL
jgi:hypothetical protein